MMKQNSTFSNGDTTKWSYEQYTITKTIGGTIRNCYLDFFPGTDNEALLKKTTLTKTDKKVVLTKQKRILKINLWITLSTNAVFV